MWRFPAGASDDLQASNSHLSQTFALTAATEALAGHNHRNTMDRIYIAIIASAHLILLGAAGMLVTRTEILHHARSAELDQLI